MKELSAHTKYIESVLLIKKSIIELIQLLSQDILNCASKKEFDKFGAKILEEFHKGNIITELLEKLAAKHIFKYGMQWIFGKNYYKIAKLYALRFSEDNPIKCD